MIRFYGLTLRRIRLKHADRVKAAAGAIGSVLLCGPASGLDTMESIGAEKCGPANPYEVAFLAPDNAPVEATAKALLPGDSSPDTEAVTLSIDGKM